MLGKTLLNLDQIASTLAPQFDANSAIRRNAAEIVQQRMASRVSPANMVSGLIDMTHFVEQLPRRMNTILDRVANNELSIHVDAIDERRLMAGLQKIANRITVGLVLAALILGAAMLMSVPTDFRILGYPGLAMMFFVIAATGGVVLLATILLTDVRAKR
jgi:predicted unusual protein kinase regulating ubiquinone biosynthesis (AarF/ABC1/UbiB family)